MIIVIFIIVLSLLFSIFNYNLTIEQVYSNNTDSKSFDNVSFLINSIKYCSINLQEFSKCLEDHSGLFTMLSLAIVLIIFVIQHQIDSKRIKSDFNNMIIHACRTIEIELLDFYKTLKNLDQSHEIIKDNQQFDFKNVILSVDAYESVLYSDMFTHFRSKTQDELSNLYSRIKSRNDLLNYRDQLRDKFELLLYEKTLDLPWVKTLEIKEKEWSDRVTKIDKRLHDYEIAIYKKLDVVNTLIENERGIAEGQDIKNLQ